MLDIERASRSELVAQIDTLTIKLAAYESAGENRQHKIQTCFGLTPKEARIIDVLMDGRVWSKEKLLDVLYADQWDEAPMEKIIDVFICKIRNKISGTGVLIETIWGTGYRISDLAALQEMVEKGARVCGAEPRPQIHKQPWVCEKPGTPAHTLKEYLREQCAATGRCEISAKGLRDAAIEVFPLSNALRQVEAGGYITLSISGKRGAKSRWFVEWLGK